MGKHGKSTGKTLLMIAGAVWGWNTPQAFGMGASAHFGAAMMGASLFSSVWAATHQHSMGSMGSVSVTRFDRQQETMSLGGVIPLVYGQRIVTGNQTYHKTDADANNLHKHVVFCEGGIDGVVNANAAGYLIPQKGSPLSNTVFSVRNRKYKDAWAMTDGKTLELYANGTLKKLELKNKDDLNTSTDVSWWQWQTEISALIAYINRLGDGWEAFPMSTTNKYAGDVVLGKLTYLGRWQRRKDGGDDWKDREQWGNVVGVVVPNSRHNESHHHHMKKRKAWYATFDHYTVERGSCYEDFAYAVTSSTEGITKAEFHDGDLPENFRETGAYPNMLWGDFHFAVSENINGNPNVEALVKGKKVLDTRTGKVAYSDNPAMCLRDFLLNKTYGGGYWISADDLDEDSFKAAADWCDGLVEYEMADGTIVKDKRYTMNIVIDSKRSVWDWVQDMMASFCAFLVFSKNKLSLRIEKEAPISYKFNESSMKNLSISQLSIDDCPNQYRIKFLDPKNNWQTATAIVDDYGDQRERGKIISKEVNLEGVTNQSQALRLGRFYRDYNKVCTLQVEFTTGVQAAHLEPADVIEVTYKDVMYKTPFRITSIKETENFEYTITARQYNPTIYNDNLGARITTYNYSVVEPSLGTPMPTEKVVATPNCYKDEHGTEHCLVRVSWVSSKTSIGVSYMVYMKKNKGEWSYVTKTPSLSYNVAAAVGDELQFYVVVVSGDERSTATYSNEVRVDGVDEPPANITGLNLIQDGSRVEAMWNRNNEVDIKGYHVLAGDKETFTVDTSKMIDAVDGDNTVTVWAEDNAGNVSGKVSATIRCDFRPAPVTGLKFTVSTGYVSLYWEGYAEHYVIDGSYHATAYGNSILIPRPSVGTYTYSVTAVNAYGFSDAVSVRVDVGETDNAETVRSISLFDSVDSFYNVKLTTEDGRKVFVKES